MESNTFSKPKSQASKLFIVAVASFCAGGATILFAFHNDSAVRMLRGSQSAGLTAPLDAPADVVNATSAPSTTTTTAAVPSAEGVCYFVTSNLNQEKLRQRTQAVAETWASHMPAGSRVYYMIDDDNTAADIPLGIKDEQLVRIPGFGSHDYDDLTARLHDYLRFLVDRLDAEFLQCQWIITVDDDTYVGARTIGRLLLDYDPKRPASMGSLYGSTRGPFVHGHFHVFSRPALGLVRRAADMCNLRASRRLEDVELALCMREAARTIPEMPAQKSFGRSIVDNVHDRNQNRIAERIGTEIIEHARSHLCVTDVHKLTAEQMRAYHMVRRGLPACAQSHR